VLTGLALSQTLSLDPARSVRASSDTKTCTSHLPGDLMHNNTTVLRRLFL
jgi:hypothetical protein